MGRLEVERLFDLGMGARVEGHEGRCEEEELAQPMQPARGGCNGNHARWVGDAVAATMARRRRRSRLLPLADRGKVASWTFEEWVGDESTGQPLPLVLGGESEPAGGGSGGGEIWRNEEARG